MDNLVDKCFCKHEVDLLKKMGLKAPSSVDDVNAMHEAAERQYNKVRGMKGMAVRSNDKEVCDDADFVMNLLKVYQGVLKPKKGRINKIGSGGEFGDLVVHLPGLLFNGVLKVFADGKKVIDEAVDQDTIDLLMKRLDKNRHYSRQAHEVVDQMIQLNDAEGVE